MRRIGILSLIAFGALGAFVAAQEAPGADELIEKLGDDSFEVREEATRRLIEMGEKAAPALEKALEAEDLETRLRAGRALRAIRGDAARKAPAAPRKGGAADPRTTRSMQFYTNGLEVRIQDGEVTVRRKVVEDGKETVKEYKGKSLDELKKKHPELKKALGGLRFEVQRGDRFDMDRWWKDMNRDWPRWGPQGGDAFKRAQQELRRSMEELERWRRSFERTPWPRGFEAPEAPEARAAGSVLGVRARRPGHVLDAHLGLKGEGLVVEAVEKGTLADRLGLERYDILLRLNGRAVRSPTDIREALAAREKDGKATANIVRRGKPLALEG